VDVTKGAQLLYNHFWVRNYINVTFSLGRQTIVWCSKGASEITGRISEKCIVPGFVILVATTRVNIADIKA
jgi:hypothetical protein